MISYLKYRWKLFELNRKIDEIESSYKKNLKTAKGEDYQRLVSEEGSEVAPISEEIESLKTSYYHRLANKHLVPMPEYQNKDFWENRNYGYGRILTSKGLWEIKKLIYQDKREKREGFITWVTALTGLGGVIIGLIAILKK